MLPINEAKEIVTKTALEMLESGLTAETAGNVSVLAQGGVMVITPSGMDYRELSSSDMVVMNLEGKILEGPWKPSIENLLHLAIYRHRRDVNAVVHTHSLYATVHAVCRREIPVVNEEMAMLVGHSVPLVPFAVFGTEELASRCLSVLGENHNAALLANHGLVTISNCAQKALKMARVIEKAAEICFLSTILGNPVILTPEQTEEIRRVNVHRYGQKNGAEGKA